MKRPRTRTALLLFTAALCLLLLSFPLHAETSETAPASEHPPQNSPLIWDGLSGDKAGALVITGGSIRIENNTLVMEDLTIVTPPMIYRNIRPAGDKNAPGFGTIYKKGGKRTISGRITIEALP